MERFKPKTSSGPPHERPCGSVHTDPEKEDDDEEDEIEAEEKEKADRLEDEEDEEDDLIQGLGSRKP